jgi:hypothetical protein
MTPPVPDITLVTSLYRAESFLPAYTEALAEVARRVQAGGRLLEAVVVANDATHAERVLLDTLALELHTSAALQVIHVPRETLYASWNRGVLAGQGRAVGFWNVDDRRTADALLAGLNRIDAGCDLVYFAWVLQMRMKWLGGISIPHHIEYPALPYDPAVFTSEMKAGPFFMFARRFFETNGPFDERFRVAGDFDWCVRAIRHTEPCPVDTLGGFFRLHGDNLSAAGKEVAEDNAAFLKYGLYDHLLPVEPETMRTVWSRWESEYTVPPQIADQLWGEDAYPRWVAWQAAYDERQRQRARSEALRVLPRLLIDHTGLRGLLYRLGIVKSARPYTRSSN